MVAVSDTGVSVISGAVTFPNCPACGQFSVAVVCATGSSGVSTDSTAPIRPAIAATQRAMRTSCTEVSTFVAAVTCHAFGLRHGSALTGPPRFHPNTRLTPSSRAASGACVAGTTRSNRSIEPQSRYQSSRR